MTRALITGIGGQDGSYLAEILLDEGVEVHGLVRRTSTPNNSRISHFASRVKLHDGDLADYGSLARVVAAVQPDEVYNLAAQSHVGTSFEVPLYTVDVTGLGAVRLLEAVRLHAPKARFYQASTSELFGSSPPPQSETTPFHPRSPYGVAKQTAHAAAVNYRESYGMHVSCGILFNHEGPRRGAEFVTRKVTLGAARIRRAVERGETPEPLLLGNLDAKRDWGHARDYMQAARLMLKRERPSDYVIATGEAHSVREFVEVVFKWHGLDWREYVKVDPKFYRPAEVNYLCGDAALARVALGWEPKVNFTELAVEMAKHDWEAHR